MTGKLLIRAATVAVGACLAASCSPAPTGDATMPAWMAGTWRQSSGKSGWTEEFWTAPRAGLMMGAGRSGTGEALDSWEHMRIVRGPKGAVSFFAMPEGARPSEFPMVARTATSITFANRAHDYPQRVRYWREGGTLRAEIALIDGSKAMHWTFVPAGR
jgi:hypothetical protein